LKVAKCVVPIQLWIWLLQTFEIYRDIFFLGKIWMQWFSNFHSMKWILFYWNGKLPTEL
jgi:hypothetical protein